MKVCFMGTPDFAGVILKSLLTKHDVTLVVTQPDRVNGRGGKVTVSDVKAIATEQGIPVFQPERIKRPEAIEELKKYDFDIIVVAAFGQILPPAILDMPKFGCVNVHASLLPKYRGAAPIQWAVINGDPVTGVTTMQMGPGLDDGDILEQKEVPIAADETGGGLFDKLALAGGDLILETLAGLEAGTITPVKQDEAKATHVGMIRKEMGNLDFTKSAAELERLVRGLNPWPSAYTFLDGKMLKIWKAEDISALPSEAAGAGADSSDSHEEDGNGRGTVEKTGRQFEKSVSARVPGTIVRAGDEVFAATGDGFLKLVEVQLEGKKRMTMSDFLRGHDLPAGLVLSANRTPAGTKS